MTQENITKSHNGITNYKTQKHPKISYCKLIKTYFCVNDNLFLVCQTRYKIKMNYI